MKGKLPGSVDDLRGLRAARWIRESTAGQVDRFGPDAQREQQDRALERYGLVDTGLAWLVAHSGRTVGTTAAFGEMLAAAGRRFDVLLVGYVSRFARDLRTAVNARHELHQAGAAILFADERLLSSDEDAWEQWAREAVEAEAYSRRLGKRIREGYAAKFRREADPGGNPPLGFRRVPPSWTLAPDPETLPRVVSVFRRYASGIVSLRDLSDETGYRIGHLAEMLKNPIYNGWVTRHGQRAPAAWRNDPPVPDDLWARVEAIRHRKAMTGGGRPRGAVVDPLRGLIFCGCGAAIQAWGRGPDGGQRRAHPADRRCVGWGPQRTYPSRTWLAPLEAQVSGIQLSDATIAQVVAALRQPETPAIPIERARLERERRDLALSHAAGRLTDADYLEAVARLRTVTVAPPSAPVDAAKAVGWLRDLAGMWGQRMAPEDRAELLAAVYERVEVRGRAFVGVTLTPEAYRHGLALALPERVACGAGEPGRSRPDVAHTIPVVGRRDWQRAARRLA